MTGRSRFAWIFILGHLFLQKRLHFIARQSLGPDRRWFGPIGSADVYRQRHAAAWEKPRNLTIRWPGRRLWIALRTKLPRPQQHIGAAERRESFDPEFGAWHQQFRVLDRNSMERHAEVRQLRAPPSA